MVTKDAMVYYNYSIIGTFTVKLKVVAEWEQATQNAGKGIMQKTGDFSASLKLQGGFPGRPAPWGALGNTLSGIGAHEVQSGSSWARG